MKMSFGGSEMSFGELKMSFLVFKAVATKLVQNYPKLKLERFRYRQAMRILIKMAYEKENSKKIQPPDFQGQETDPGWPIGLGPP